MPCFRSGYAVKKLLKFHAKLSHETKGEAEIGGDRKLIKSIANAFLKRLDESSLTKLVEAVENGPAEEGSCVLMECRSDGTVQLGKYTVIPSILAAKLWRYSHITLDTNLKQINICKAHNLGQSCCNPFHYSLIASYSTEPVDLYSKSDEDSSPSSPLSPHLSSPLSDPTHQTDQPRPRRSCDLRSDGRTDTSLLERVYTGDTRSIYNEYSDKPPLLVHLSDTQQLSDSDADLQQDSWALIAYWELRSRVGGLFGVCASSADVFQQLHARACGYCLKDVQPSDVPADVRKVRTKIGLGVRLTSEADGVWLYNRSHSPVFVSAPSPDRSGGVWRIGPGYSAKIYGNVQHETDITVKPHITPPYTESGQDIQFTGGSLQQTDNAALQGAPVSTDSVQSVPISTGLILAAPSTNSSQIPVDLQGVPIDINQDVPVSMNSIQGVPPEGGPPSYNNNEETSTSSCKPVYSWRCVRVSFAKGWGTRYKRQFVTSCPCWIQVMIKVPHEHR